MYHSIIIDTSTTEDFSFNGAINTYDDWHLVPSSRPTIVNPPLKTSYLDIPGASGSVDATEWLTGFPTYDDREGEIEFIVLNDYGVWTQRRNAINRSLHGKKAKIMLEDEKDYYYIGRLTVDDWKSEKIIFLQKDSAITYDYSDDKEKLETISDITTLVLCNDTLYENRKSTNEYDDIKSIVTAPDPDNENVCNISETITTSYGQSNTTTYQEIITNTENGFVVSASNTDQKIFFVYINSTTSFLRKKRPAFTPEKAKHFDLLGRPANKKYIMSVPRGTL